MPKKKKIKSKVKKVSKKTKPKVKKRVSKKIKNKISKNAVEKELIFKTRPEWTKSALVNKTKYQKKYSDSIKNNNEFWKKEGKRLNGMKMEH